MARAKSAHIKCLKRRMIYLTDKLNHNPAIADSNAASFIKQEIAALTWALPILAAALAANKKG